jgi:AcrR family transcriptional regulator
MKPRIRQKRKDGLKRQEQILQIALKLFAEKGYHAASINDIIEAAGIAKGTFYLHFTGKFDLLDRMISSNIDLLSLYVKELDISKPVPVAEIRQIYKNFVAVLGTFKNFRYLVKLVLSEYMNIDPALTEKVNGFFDSTIAMTAVFIRQAQVIGRVHPTLDPDISSTCIVGSVRELLYRWAVRSQPIDFNASLTSMLDLYLNGLLIEREWEG